MQHFHWMMLFSLCCLFTFAGCGSSTDSLMKQQINLMHDMADAIENEDESALKSIEARSEALRKKMEAIDISEAEKKRLAEKYKDELAEATQRMMTAMMGKAMSEMGKAAGGGMPGGIPGLPTP